MGKTAKDNFNNPLWFISKKVQGCNKEVGNSLVGQIYIISQQKYVNFNNWQLFSLD